MICGIDPGFSGAVAFIDFHGALLSIHPMPVKIGKTLLQPEARKTVDAVELARLLAHGNPELVGIERVTASPEMGVTSAFRFGEGFGAVTGVCDALGLKRALFHPAAWKAALGLSADKKKSIDKAKELFPASARLFDQGRRTSADFAEAALIAWCARKIIYGRS